MTEPAPNVSPVEQNPYRSFVLDVRDESVVAGSVRLAPEPMPTLEEFQRYVVLADFRVTVTNAEGDRVASAVWDGKLSDAQAKLGKLGTTWSHLERALRGVVGAPEHPPPITAPRPAHGSRNFLLSIVGIVALTVLPIVAYSRCQREPSKPAAPVVQSTPSLPAPAPMPSPLPAAQPPADTYAKRLAEHRLHWSDVSVSAETSIELAEREPAQEAGKRLCVDGTVASITRADRDGTRAYAGVIETTAGDRVTFVVGGSVGAIVKRTSATICGVVTGFAEGAIAIDGLFDLPENRAPMVEAP